MSRSHHQHGRWEARIGRVCGNKYLYLGTFSTEEEAARAYDRAAIRYRGPRAITNYSRTNYENDDFSDLDALMLQQQESGGWTPGEDTLMEDDDDDDDFVPGAAEGGVGVFPGAPAPAAAHSHGGHHRPEKVSSAHSLSPVPEEPQFGGGRRLPMRAAARAFYELNGCAQETGVYADVVCAACLC